MDIFYKTFKRIEYELRQMRTFTEGFKEKKVKLFEQGKMKVSDIHKMYGVSPT
jgi:transposase-like protein